MRRTVFSRLTSATALAMTITLVQVPVAFAAAQQCVPARSGHDDYARHVAVSGSPNGVQGVRADILELNPYYTGHNGTGTNASIMLLHWSPSVQWAQLGWSISTIQDGTTTRRQIFTEFYLSPSQNYYRFWNGHAIQTQTNYKITTAPQTKIYFFVDNQLLSSQSNIAITDYQLFGETHDKMDQMPGLSSNVQTFRNAKWLSWSTGQWTTVTSAPWCDGPDCAKYYGKQNLGGGTYYIWDTSGSTGATSVTPDVPLADSSAAVSTAKPSNAIAQADLPMIGLETAVEVAPLSAGRYSGMSPDDALRIAEDEPPRLVGRRPARDHEAVGRDRDEGPRLRGQALPEGRQGDVTRLHDANTTQAPADGTLSGVSAVLSKPRVRHLVR